MSTRKQPPKDLYPSIEHAVPSSPLNFQAEDEENDEILTLKANIQVLQQAQVNQSIEHQHTKSTLSNIERILAQISARDSSRTVDHLEEEQEAGKTVREVSVSSFRPGKYSKKLPDPLPLSNETDPTFESWRI